MSANDWPSLDGVDQSNPFLPRRPVRRILMPTDFSKTSLEALGLASELARACNAELHFVWIDMLGSERPEGQFPSGEQVMSASWHGAPAGLHEMAEGCTGAPEIVSSEERAMEVGPGIALYAYEHQIDLIVMATAGRRGLARFFMGSVTEQVVRYAPCSVLVVGPQAERRAAGSPPRILSAVDFSDSSLEAARLGHELSQSLSAHHELLHVVATPPVPSFYGPEQAYPQSVMDEIAARSEHELQEFVNDSVPGSAWRVAFGDPVREILREVSAHSADLLVVGSHGLSGLPLLLLGSVAEKLVRVSPVPVLVVRPEGEVSAEQVREGLPEA